MPKRRRTPAYPDEIKALIRHRVKRHLGRYDMSRHEFAFQVSAWSGLLEWMPEALDWQVQHQTSDAYDEVEGAKSDSGWPITGRVLDRWLTGEWSRDGRREWIYPSPSTVKLAAIAHFLIHLRQLEPSEIVPDDRGFALADSITRYVGHRPTLHDYARLEGLFEAVTETKSIQRVQRLQLKRLPDGTLFVQYGVFRNALTHAYGSAPNLDAPSASSSRADHRSGWG